MLKEIIIDNLYQVGAVLKTHGIKGEVKVFPTTDDVSRFKNMKDLLVDFKGQLINLEVTGLKKQNNIVILKFKDIDDINDVEKYVGCNLYVTKENRVRLKKDEYFIADLIGLNVITDTGEEFGVISDVLQTGANDVYEITMKDNRAVLVPAIKECILSVDIDNKLMTIHVMDGLLD